MYAKCAVFPAFSIFLWAKIQLSRLKLHFRYIPPTDKKNKLLLTLAAVVAGAGADQRLPFDALVRKYLQTY